MSHSAILFKLWSKEWNMHDKVRALVCFIRTNMAKTQRLANDTTPKRLCFGEVLQMTDSNREFFVVPSHTERDRKAFFVKINPKSFFYFPCEF